MLEGIKRLGRLVGVAALERGLESEDEASDRWDAMNESLLFDGEKPQTNGVAPSAKDKKMMVAGDMKIDVHNYPKKESPPQPSSKSLSLLKLAAGAALMATGVGTGAGIYTAIPALVDLLKPTPIVQPETKPAVATSDEETWIGVELDKE